MGTAMHEIENSAGIAQIHGASAIFGILPQSPEGVALLIGLFAGYGWLFLRRRARQRAEFPEVTDKGNPRRIADLEEAEDEPIR